MSKKGNKLIIDLDKWITQQGYIKEFGGRLNTLSQKIKRAKDGETSNPIEYWYIPELNITLVRREK